MGISTKVCLATTYPMKQNCMYKDEEWKNCFQVDSLLGKGGYAQTFQVKYKEFKYAAKMYHFDTKMESFLRETVSLTCGQQLQYIVKIHQILFSQKQMKPTLILELCDKTLLHCLHRDKITIDTAISNLYCIAFALSALHNLGFHHCDLKPDNILCKGKEVRLADFGQCQWKPFDIRIPHLFWEVQEEYDPSPCINYRAPEIYKESKELYSSAVDIWSLGVIFFQMLKTNSRKIRNTNLHECFSDSCTHACENKIRDCLFLQIKILQKELEGEIPLDIWSLLDAMLEKDPMKRITASEIVEYLLEKQIIVDQNIQNGKNNNNNKNGNINNNNNNNNNNKDGNINNNNNNNKENSINYAELQLNQPILINKNCLLFGEHRNCLMNNLYQVARKYRFHLVAIFSAVHIFDLFCLKDNAVDHCLTLFCCLRLMVKMTMIGHSFEGKEIQEETKTKLSVLDIDTYCWHICTTLQFKLCDTNTFIEIDKQLAKIRLPLSQIHKLRACALCTLHDANLSLILPEEIAQMCLNYISGNNEKQPEIFLQTVKKYLHIYYNEL